MKTNNIKKFGEKITRTEKWLDNTLEPNRKITRWVLEFVASFVLIVLIGIPIAWSTSGQGISNSAEYIGEVYFMRVFYLSTLFIVTYLMNRKFGIAGAPLPLAYAWATKRIDGKESGIRFLMQVGAGFAAAALLFSITIWIGTFEAMDMQYVNGEWTGTIGTSIGSVKPVMFGVPNTQEGIQYFYKDYGYYGFRMITEFMLIIMMTSSIVFWRRRQFRTHVIGRYATQFAIVSLLMMFQSHSPNLARMISGTTISYIYGGFYDWALLGMVITSHAVGLSLMFLMVRSSRIRFIN